MNWLVEWRNANAGIAPAPRLCVDAIDLAFWFNCFSLALRSRRATCQISIVLPGAIERVTTTVRVVVADNRKDNDARKGRMLRHVRR